MKFIAVALNYSAVRRSRGHDVSFFQSLRTGAESLSHEFRILTREHMVLDPELDADVIPCLPRSKDPSSAVRGIADYLESLPISDSVTVVIYEGNLSWYEELCSVAVNFPQHQFIVNLFDSEPLLVMPARSGERFLGEHPIGLLLQSRSEAHKTFEDCAPSNLKATADTERRLFLARAIGIPAVSPWPLHSQISAIRPSWSPWGGEAPIRVLIPLANRQANRRLIASIATVAEQTHRLLGSDRIAFVVAGALAGSAESEKLIRGLERHKVEVRDAELGPAAYAELFASADIAWFPIADYYTTQSSGKALDALVTGTPILAPSGSFAAATQSKWIEGSPAYAGTAGATEMLASLPYYLSHLQLELMARVDEIRCAYSAESAVRRLVEIVDAGMRAEAPSPAAISRSAPIVVRRWQRIKRQRILRLIEQIAESVTAIFVALRLQRLRR